MDWNTGNSSAGNYSAKYLTKKAAMVDFVLEVSRVGLKFSIIVRLVPASDVNISRKFALLTRKLMLKSPHGICLASVSIGEDLWKASFVF